MICVVALSGVHVVSSVEPLFLEAGIEYTIKKCANDTKQGGAVESLEG